MIHISTYMIEMEQQKLLNDNGGSGYASKIVWTCPASGTYYVRVRDYSSSRGSPDVKYDIWIFPSPSQYFKTNFPLGDNVFSTNDTIHITWDVEGFTGDEGRIRILFYPGGGGPYAGWYPIAANLPIEDGSYDIDLSNLRDINGNPIPMHDPLRCRVRVGIYVPSSPGSFGGAWLKWNTPYGTQGQYYDETGHFWIED